MHDQARHGLGDVQARERSIAAVLSRGKVVYATGSAIGLRKKTKLLLTPPHSIGKGSYTLTLRHERNRQRETITVN